MVISWSLNKTLRPNIKRQIYRLKVVCELCDTGPSQIGQSMTFIYKRKYSIRLTNLTKRSHNFAINFVCRLSTTRLHFIYFRGYDKEYEKSHSKILFKVAR